MFSFLFSQRLKETIYRLMELCLYISPSFLLQCANLAVSGLLNADVCLLNSARLSCSVWALSPCTVYHQNIKPFYSQTWYISPFSKSYLMSLKKVYNLSPQSLCISVRFISWSFLQISHIISLFFNILFLNNFKLIEKFEIPEKLQEQ